MQTGVRCSVFGVRCNIAVVAEHPRAPILASVNDLAWMEGRWIGLHGEERIEEQWSAPDAETIMGMFRWIRDGRIYFYELIAIEEEGNQVVMRIKHFYPGLKGWEEKDDSVTFWLTSVTSEDAAWFREGEKGPQWLLYHRGAGEMQAWFEKPGYTPELADRFVYRLL